MCRLWRKYSFLPTLFGLLLCFLLTATPCLSETAAGTTGEKLTFVGLYPSTTSKTRFLILVYTEALKRLGIEFEYLDVPARRASLMVNQGEADGELFRVAGYNANYPNLVQVPERNYCFGHSAYSVRVKDTIRSWKDLGGKDYRVGVFRGMRFAEDRLSELGPEEVTVDRVSSTDQGFKMLLEGRIDIFVTTDSQYYAFLELEAGRVYSIQQGAAGDIRNIGTLDRQAVYAWLHKSHKILLEPIANELRNMRAEGLFDSFYDQAGLPPLLKRRFLCKD